VYLGESTIDPCPSCGGKCSDDNSACTSNDDCGAGPTCNFDTMGDGVRDGLCIGGASDGLSCDATARNASFPAHVGAPGGGLYSLDCLPPVGRNVSGSGLKIRIEESTAGASLPSGLDCGGIYTGFDCPCLVCSNDITVACSADSDCSGQLSRCSGANIICDANADCSSANLGTCTAFSNTRCSLAHSVQCHGNNSECQGVDVGTCDASSCSAHSNGEFPQPNNCADFGCSDIGDNNGSCTTGPDIAFCDAVVKADGSGILACGTNADCDVNQVGIPAGNCTSSSRLACFLDPIVAGGAADPSYPVTGAIACSPPTSNAGINVVTGLPGPVRRITQRSVRSLCASDHGTAYTPGAGGCP
jgi:hypothetical protein